MIDYPPETPYCAFMDDGDLFRQPPDAPAWFDISGWLHEAEETGAHIPEGIAELPAAAHLCYPASLRRSKGSRFLLIRKGAMRALLIAGADVERIGFEGTRAPAGGARRGSGTGTKANAPLLFCPLTHANACALRALFPFTAPSRLTAATTMGFGDRLGRAGAGHIMGVEGTGAAPVLAQLSVRELTLMERTHEDLLDTASWFVFQMGYEKPWGADGDHLKTVEWARKAIAVGFTMITADVSDHFKPQFQSISEREGEARFDGFDPDLRKLLESEYLGKTFRIESQMSITFSRASLGRMASVYWEALDHAQRMYEGAADEKGGDAFDFELSIDEVTEPTSIHDHLFVALETKRRRMRLFSLAPRFIGEFQKGIDYIGDPERFATEFAAHAAIARHFGYRISVHSGSDKFSIFPAVGRLSRGTFHLKTAGTYWLEAMTLVAGENPRLYRSMHAKALASFDNARRYYHVTTDLSKIPTLDSLRDDELPSLFRNPDARQLIHISYGELFADQGIRREFFDFLDSHAEAYGRRVADHVKRHLASVRREG